MKNNRKYIYSAILSFWLIGFAACRPTVTNPKPFGYFKIKLPAKHQYQNFDSASFPFQFRYPVYAAITQDSDLVRTEQEPYWINITFPKLNATIYLSYKKASATAPLQKLINQSYKLSYSNDVKADFIHAPKFRTDNGLQGVYYHVGGNAATNYQFYLTDNKTNFMRGALYFNASPNADSLAPAVRFLKQDLDTLIASFRFVSK